MKLKLVLSCFFAFFMASVFAAEDPVELYWQDLLPDGYVPEENIPEIDHNNAMSQIFANAPVRTDLNGKKVKIPGFVVPLEGDEEKLTEFLLVPFFGACIHVPPPPSNQIVYVSFPDGVEVDDLYDAVWITGTLQTDGWKGDLASVGYNMTGESVAIFE